MKLNGILLTTALLTSCAAPAVDRQSDTCDERCVCRGQECNRTGHVIAGPQPLHRQALGVASVARSHPVLVGAGNAAQEVGIGGRRKHAVHAHLRRKLEREALGHRDRPRFARGVQARTRTNHDGADRGGDRDRAVRARTKEGDGCLRRVEQRLGVDVEDAVELAVLELHRVLEPVAHARVVDEHVESATPVGSELDEVAHLTGTRHIDGECASLVAQCFGLLLRGRGVDVGDHDERAFAREPARDVLADARACPGHDDRPALEPVHPVVAHVVTSRWWWSWQEVRRRRRRRRRGWMPRSRRSGRREGTRR